MDFLNATNNLYGWISTLIRRAGKRKSPPIELANQCDQSTSNINLIKNSDKLVPTLNFIANTEIDGNSPNANCCASEKSKQKKLIKINSNSSDADLISFNETEQETDESESKLIECEKMNESVEKEKKIKTSAENSIEEEIEENVITSGSSSGGNGGKLKKNDFKKVSSSLFNIDSDEDDGNFKIDDSELAGAKIAQHFKDDKNEEKLSSKSKSKIKSGDGNAVDAVNKSEQLEDQSLTNQSTTNDVSELIDEVSDDEHKNGQTKSLELSSNYVNYEKRDYQSLEATISFMELTNQDHSKSHNSGSIERDHSLEEIIEQNQSIEMSLNDANLSELNPNIDINNESAINKILGDTIKCENDDQEQGRISLTSLPSSQGDDDMEALKQKILSLKQSPKTVCGPHLARDISFEQTDDQVITIKQMEKVQGDYSKEILEDITEESEKCSIQLQIPNDPHQTSNEFNSIVSLNMIQMLEDKIQELQEIVTNKDICMAALNMQLDASQRREAYASELPPSGRDSCSLATTSTEYRTLQDDFGNKIFDFHNEIAQRDSFIEKLTDSLQQSMEVRENLQQQSEKLTNEVQALRKQLTETLESIKKPYWPRDQESNCQRLSEISIDLVSESDEDLDRQFLTDNEEKFSRNSKERQLSYDFGQSQFNENIDFDQGQMAISKQIEQFKKYLNPDELRIFFMVQKKFDDFLSEELEKTKMKFDGEIKILADQMEAEKHERDFEINRLKQLLTSVKNGSTELMQLRQELDDIHAKEMEDLRLYFEQKCSDLEKQFSEEIFSQQSQRNDNNNSDLSDNENLSEDKPKEQRSKENSPRKRTREELYSSPSHRQMTPTTLSPEIEQTRFSFSDLKAKEEDPEITVSELKTFYKDKIQEIKLHHDKIVKKLRDKVKSLETKYADNEFMSKPTGKTKENHKMMDEVQTSSYIIIDEDEMNNDGHEINKIVAEYERRLQEQVKLAKEDIIRELEKHIQALLLETTTEDHNWPPELILLREKFTAKSQLEIAQLQIKHEDEMSRLKIEFEKHLNRKIKRQSTFDLSRDLDQIISEREGLRKLSSSFRYILSELTKCVLVCENDLNATFVDELQRISQQYQHEQSLTGIGGSGDDNSILNATNQFLQTTLSKRLRFVPDVTNLLTVIEDPELLSFISQNSSNLLTTNPNDQFNLIVCIEKLNNEANQLLQLSENFCHIQKERKSNDDASDIDKNDSCEEEDGLKSGLIRTPVQKILRANSMNENLLRDKIDKKNLNSLPPDLNRLQFYNNESIIEDFTSTGPVSELNFQVHELKNRLVKSESDRVVLQHELEATIKRNCELGVELTALRDQLEQLDSQKEDFSEGYGLGDIKSPQRIQSAKKDKKSTTNFSQLQEKARNLLSTPLKSSNNGENTLLQIIEDFCREGDKVVEDGKKDRDDLQGQIDAADKQLKATRQFLEDQAADRELERDEFVKEIEKLKYQLRDKEKERHSLQNFSKEISKSKKHKRHRNVEQMDHQIKDLNEQIAGFESKKDKLEIELKASIDKIFVLREIISELETQVETKALNEHVLNEKVKELENFIGSQNRSNDALKIEVEKLKTKIGQDYQQKISNLEEMLKNSRPSAEQNAILQQFGEQLRDIATALEQKTKVLESLHQSVASASCSTSPIEDVSVSGKVLHGSPVHANVTPRINSLPIEEIQKVFENLSKHTRVEEAAIKRIKDLEMQIGNIRNSYGELQQERDVLQDRMSEQMTRISNLQIKLEEQRRRAEDLQRSGTSDLNIRIHDLQNDLQNLNETLSVRDKQINNLKNHLEKSKSIIDRQETELAMGIQSDRSVVEKLQLELKQKIDENKKLKDKMKSEMINKLALPDLMETMLADKNEEIDHLKEQLDSKELELKSMQVDRNNLGGNSASASANCNDGKLSARTLSDIVSISEYDEPDVIRRAHLDIDNPLILPSSSNPERTMDISKIGTANLTLKRTEDLTIFNSLQTIPTFDRPNFFTDPSILPSTNMNSVNSFGPRQINFSEFVEDSKHKGSTPKTITYNDDINEIKILKMKLTKAENQIDHYKMKTDQIEELKIRIENLIKEKENLQAQLINLNDEIVRREKFENDFKKLEEEFIASKMILTKMEDDLNAKNEEVLEIETRLLNIQNDNDLLNKKLMENSDNSNQLQNVLQQVEVLNKIINEKDEILTKQDKNLLNLQEIEKNNEEQIHQLQNKLAENQNLSTDLQDELTSVRNELIEKVLLYEKCLLDIQAYQKNIEHLRDHIKDKDSIIASLSTDSKSIQTVLSSIQQKLNDAGNLSILKIKLNDEQSRNSELEKRNSILEIELEKLRSQNSENSKPFSLDEIAKQVEKELNYSAQLDSNILKAIESEEENNLDVQVKTDTEKLIERDLQHQLQTIKDQLNAEKLNAQKLQKELQDEKIQSHDIQQQDVSIIEAMRLRLEEAMAKEQKLNVEIDEEREKCDRLTTQISVFQRSEARKSSLLLRSPPDSPRKSSRSLDFENDLVDRLKAEIKLINAQNEREKDRSVDLQRVLEREKSRFDTELNERIEYSEKLKREMDKIAREKDSSENEIEHLQERLMLQSQEIESLESRIGLLQEAETRRAQRRDRDRNETTQNVVELQELKTKCAAMEFEQEHLNRTINLLRGDIERGAQRETKLAEALGNSNSDSSIPHQFISKMKEMNSLLAENTKENRQMSETVHSLTDERKSLQKKCDELENQLGNGNGTNISELEDRANHLLGRYLRVESHRKALVHQKRYLLISLQSYEDSENKAVALLNGNNQSSTKRNLFKSAALVIIAIQRMKFIVKRWHTGKRIVSKSVFTITQQKRPTNTYNIMPISLSPPCRDTPLQNPMRPLQAPALISECTTNNPNQQKPTQKLHKTDWAHYKN